MKYEDLQKLKFILEDESMYKASNTQMVTQRIKDFIHISKDDEMNKDEVIDQAYMLWETNNYNKTDYQKMMMKNQIIEYVKGTGNDFVLMVWYFKDNKKPFYVEVKTTKEKEVICNETLQSLVNDFSCGFEILKDKISEVEAIKLKKQIVYYYHVLGLPLLNHKEMK